MADELAPIVRQGFDEQIERRMDAARASPHFTSLADDLRAEDEQLRLRHLTHLTRQPMSMEEAIALCLRMEGPACTRVTTPETKD